MRILAKNPAEFRERIDSGYSPESSIVLRYARVFGVADQEGDDEPMCSLLAKTSLREGVRFFRLMDHRGVEIFVLDETSAMATRTLKSIDGCVTAAICASRGYKRVVFESGGNTGTALTRYCRRIGLETFFFCPEANLPLLNGAIYTEPGAHLVSVWDRAAVKPAAAAFRGRHRLTHIPETDWRLRASLFRGGFILETMLENGRFDWISQTVSAAFGPIGIFRVLETLGAEIGVLPRFLGIQQAANCPMFSAWRDGTAPTITTPPSVPLLTPVMYDAAPQTYGTWESLRHVLEASNGTMTTIDRQEFVQALEKRYNGQTLLEHLAHRGVNVAVDQGEVVEKTGLISLIGTLKAIDAGLVADGSRLLCCVTSGVSDADGAAEPEWRVTDLETSLDGYARWLGWES